MAQPLSARPARDAYEVLQIRPDASQIVIRAAFRALAALYHPDSDESTGSTRRMAELNDAYAQLRTADRRAVYDRFRQAAPQSVHSQPTGSPTRTAPPPRGADEQKGILDFGRYVGWSIANLAAHDPDYLRWLSRHSSGIRYRREIAELLDGEAKRTAERSRTKKR
jgi:curved DNA-binding protein CbpA